MVINFIPTRSNRIAFAAAVAAFSLALGACTPSSDTSSSSKEQQGSSQVATGGKDFGTADQKTAEFGSEAKNGEFPRQVKHAMGTTEIKQEPQRVVVLDTGELDATLSLGVTPVGMVTTKGANPVPKNLADQVKDVETVGTIQELNVEKIAELKPDLIIGSQLRAEKLYPELSQIAPTVFSIRPGFPWKENFTLAAAALGREEKADQVLGEYERKVNSIKNDVKPGTTVSMVRFMPEKLRLYANKSLIGVVLQDAGLKRPKSQDRDELAAEISPEKIDEADADYVFYSSYGDPKATGEETVVNSNSWKNLKAVKEGRAHRVEDDVWFLGLGPTGAIQIADDLKKFLSS